MKRTNHWIFHFCIFVLFLPLFLACSSRNDKKPLLNQNPTSENLEKAQVYLTATITQKPTPTFTAKSPTPTAQNWMKEQVCLAREANISNYSLDGKVILIGQQSTYVHDISTSSSIKFPRISGGYVGLYSEDFHLSPNGKWLAYIENYTNETYQTQSRRLRLISGDLIPILPSGWDADWQWILGWIDDNWLAIWLPHQEAGTITVLNPFTAKTQLLSTGFTFPESRYKASPWYIWGRPKLFFSPDLTKVIFPNADKGVLWDVVAQKELWSGNIYQYAESDNAKWSQDGKYAVIIVSKSSGEKLYLYDAVKKQATHIPLAGYEGIGEFSFSPDGQKIAIWVTPDFLGWEPKELMVIDLERKTITDTCVHSSAVVTSQPVWSSLHTNMFITSVTWQNPVSAVAMIDLSKYVITPVLFDKVKVAGWITE
jgi:hypothetical protein